uniref:Uncharacterized protein n=1 Tax=Meloidogyne incognita TaxID=6306 RepID=A0A914NML5_MELIC
MSQIGRPMKTADLYDQPPEAASAEPPPPANDQLYEQPPPIDDGKQSTAVTKSEEAQRPTTNPTQKGEYENIDDMQERKKRENKRGRSMASLIHQRVRLHLLRRNQLRRMSMWNNRSSKSNQNLSQNRKRRWS